MARQDHSRARRCQAPTQDISGLKRTVPGSESDGKIRLWGAALGAIGVNDSLRFRTDMNSGQERAQATGTLRSCSSAEFHRVTTWIHASAMASPRMARRSQQPGVVKT